MGGGGKRAGRLSGTRACGENRMVGVWGRAEGRGEMENDLELVGQVGTAEGPGRRNQAAGDG